MKYIWYIETFMNDGSIKTQEFPGKFYNKKEISRAQNECKQIFEKDNNIMSLYAYHIWMFSKTKGVNTISHRFYMNNAGLNF